jgi:hypothetical protein
MWLCTAMGGPDDKKKPAVLGGSQRGGLLDDNVQATLPAGSGAEGRSENADASNLCGSASLRLCVEAAAPG